MDRFVLFESDNIKVICQDFGSETIVITFNEAGFLAEGHAYWGDFFFEQRRQSAIGVMSKAPNWFPPDCMRYAALAIRAVINGRRVVTYGFSQGGYGALKYAGALGAAVAMAFSPKWSINPADVDAFDDSKTMYYRPALRNGHKVIPEDVAGESYIFYDPLLKNDLNHATRLQAACGSQMVVMPFTGHETIRLLTESGLSESMVNMFLCDDRPSPRQLRNLVRRGRRHSPTYRVQKSEYLLQRLNRLPNDVGYLNRHIAAMDPHEAALPAAFFALHRKAFAEAAAILDTTPDIDLAPQAIWLWNWCRNTGFLAGEIRAAQVLRTQFQDAVFERLHVVNTLIHTGDPAAASAELAHIATKMSYDFRDVMPTMFEFANNLGRPDVFEQATAHFIATHSLPDVERHALRLRLLDMFAQHSDPGAQRVLALLEAG